MSNWYEQCAWDIGGLQVQNSISRLEERACLRANLTHRLPNFLELDLLQLRPNKLQWTIHLSAKVLQGQNIVPFIERISLFPILPEVLVISGNPKPKLDSLLLADELANYGTSIALAISPFDSDERIKAKCLARNLTRLYFQVCTDTQQLTKQIETVRKYNPRVTLSACWLVPTRANWQAMHLFPWSGALFSEDWLRSYTYALECAQQQLTWMGSQDVDPLIEPRRFTTTTFSTVNLFN